MKEKVAGNVWLKRGAVVTAAYLCVLSFAKILSLQCGTDSYWGGIYFGYNMSAILIFGAAAWFLNRFLHNSNQRMKGTARVGGLLFSAAIVYGAYAHYVNDILGPSEKAFCRFF